MEEPRTVARRVVAHGLVQGVFYRDTCRREAQAAGVHGWVRNTREGTVEALFEGSPEAVQHMVEWARRGSRASTVDRVDVTDEQPTGLTGFDVRA